MWKASLLLAPVALAIDLSLDSSESIKSASKIIAEDLLTWYEGDEPGGVPGLLPGGLECNPEIPGVHCWWQAGAMWGELVNYWRYTGDDSYNGLISEAMLFQKGVSQLDHHRHRNGVLMRDSPTTTSTHLISREVWVSTIRPSGHSPLSTP
jgi:hypothetical protein